MVTKKPTGASKKTDCEAREWTIKLYEDTYNYYEDVQGPNTGETAHGIEAVRVIEKSAFEKLREENERLAHALKTLRNEVKGTLSAHKFAIQYDHGNSNWACLEIAITQAEEALNGK